MFFKSLISRVILLNIILLVVGIGTFSLFHVRREQIHLISSTKESAELLLSTIEKSIFNSMRLGNSQDVQAILEMVGRSPRLINVRIFHPDGTILKSSHPQEIGRRVNPLDMSLFRSNRHEGMFRVEGREVLGMVKPIISDERCFVCHGIGRKVIGVMSLNYSLSDTTQTLREAAQLFMASTVVIVLLLSAGISFVLIRFVKRPIQAMARKMAKVERGDLSVRMEPKLPDEIGSLMHSFNSMADSLERTNEELKQYHFQQMERADRLASVGEMATGIAHEIKNPLAGISGAISVIAEEFEGEDPRREVIAQVLEQIKRLDKTATDLLYFGKPGRPEFSYVDINELVNKTLFFVSQHPESRNVHRVKELTRNLPQVWVDEKQVQQVLFNIMINAIQAMKEGGTLTVQTEAVEKGGEEWVRVAIIDTGAGIPPEGLEKIFTPFFTTKTQGTGLGLAICKRLVEQQGGAISVDSRVDFGTSFFVELPLFQGQPINEREIDGAQA